MTAPATTAETITLEISTKNLNIGDTSARLGFSLKLLSTPNQANNEADFLAKVQLLCGSKLQLKLLLTQDTLPGVEGPKTINAVVESKNLSVSPKGIGGGFVFSINDIDPGNLAHFTKKDCTIEVKRIGLASSDEDPE